jgi:hypothetical protein
MRGVRKHLTQAINIKQLQMLAQTTSCAHAATAAPKECSRQPAHVTPNTNLN